jgi:hypothetical protein
MIVMPSSGIHRQVEVWIENEGVEEAKPDSRSNISIGDKSVVQGV